jgi:YrbI family 3-deoxy-D-manno-octulosonate 8-phosphate phosphatase
MALDVLAELELEPQKVCYIGDDLPDIPVLRFVGLAVAVADAAEEVRRIAHFTTSRAGGEGAVRETVELILRNQKRWDDLIQRFYSA